MYTFLKDKFTMLLGEYIDRIGGIIIPYDKKKFVKHSMGALKFESYLLRDQKRLQHMVIILVLLIMFEIGWRVGEVLKPIIRTNEKMRYMTMYAVH